MRILRPKGGRRQGHSNGKVSFGELGEMEVGITFWDYRNEHEREPHLTLWEWFDESQYNGHSLGKEPKITVNYCLWCGRDLREKKNEKH